MFDTFDTFDTPMTENNILMKKIIWIKKVWLPCFILTLHSYLNWVQLYCSRHKKYKGGIQIFKNELKDALLQF